MKILSLSCRNGIRGHANVFIITLATLCIASCSSAHKRLVTYHVEFEADGVPYSGTTKFTWYAAQNFEYSFTAIDFDKARIRGTLKDGTKYIIATSTLNYNNYYFDKARHGRVAVGSIIFLRTAPNLAESFDKSHTHSPGHIVHITNSYITVGDAHGISYGVAEAAQRAYYAAGQHIESYYTVGVKITPFHDAKQAVDDFYNTGPPRYPAPKDYKPSTFNFHPIEARVENSDADITYDGKLFHVMLPNTGLATPWVLATGVHGIGGVVRGLRPNIVVGLDGEEITIKPLGRMVNAGINTATGRALLFYECDTSLGF